MANTGIDTEKKYVKMKKDVYEHLAHTFLDKKKNKKNFKNNRLWFYLGIGSIIFLWSLLVFARSAIKNKIFLKSISVIQDKTPTIINYNFSAEGVSKIKILTFNLGGIDLSGYHFIELAVRTQEKSRIDSTIKIEIGNSLLEKDSKFIEGLNNKWKRFSFPLENFKLISDWTNVKSVSFIIEDWNVFFKKDKIFIDEVRFVE